MKYYQCPICKAYKITVIEFESFKHPELYNCPFCNTMISYFELINEDN